MNSIITAFIVLCLIVIISWWLYGGSKLKYLVFEGLHAHITDKKHTTITFPNGEIINTINPFFSSNFVLVELLDDIDMVYGHKNIVIELVEKQKPDNYIGKWVLYNPNWTKIIKLGLVEKVDGSNIHIQTYRSYWIEKLEDIKIMGQLYGFLDPETGKITKL